MSVLAGQADLEIGVNLGEQRARLALELFAASGDDPATPDVNEAWDHLYSPAHKWLGLTDVIGTRRNIAGGVLHMVYRAADQMRLSADFHAFLRPQRGTDVDSYGGTEVDLGALYTIGGGLTLRGGYALFLPNKTQYVSERAVHFAELELRLDMR